MENQRVPNLGHMDATWWKILERAAIIGRVVQEPVRGENLASELVADKDELHPARPLMR